MNDVLSNVNIKKCYFDDVKSFVVEYYKNNQIIADSFLEGHIRESNFYKIMYNDNIIGYFAINKETVLVLFNVFEKYRNISQELFTLIKKYESIKEALIPTGDEFFISHAVDNYVKIEKQAYFSIYTDKTPSKIINIELTLADIEKDGEILNICYDFLKGEIENIKKSADEEIYIARHENKIIGFGVIEYQKIMDQYASIGMIVREEYRQKGYGANILNGLKNIVKGKGLTAISGCWYYNHNSKKQWKVQEHIQRPGY
ncbi:MAG: GNAT family N-acetyltransferase [Treponema sp.]|jgi:predicted acetyltransferase|nr:GNAT family N-acetyltransferase [Treponema sp.]